MRFFQAFAVFFKFLFNREFAEQVAKVAEGKLPAPPAEKAPVPAPAAPKSKPPARSEAVTLLATLQREARFVDIVQEPLDGYSDAQVGAATRDVLRNCAKTLDRLFAIRPVVDAEEGSPHETPAKFNAALYSLTGNVSGEPPYRGTLVHRGWQVTKCELPTWSGTDDAAEIIAPAELELR